VGRLLYGGFSPIVVTAALSVLILVGAVGLELRQFMRDKSAVSSYSSTQESAAGADAAAASESAADLTSIGGETTALGDTVLDGLVTRYVTLQEQGLYTPEIGEQVAEKMASSLTIPVTYKTYTQSDIRTDPDTSYTRMLAYRTDLQKAFAPLLKNKDPEFEIFARFADTKDPIYLDKLRAAAKNYFAAADAAATIVVPQDESPQHIAVLNALQQFGTTLNLMADNAGDPLAAVVLLRSYNQAESDVFASFKALVTYEKQKRS